MSAPSTNLLRYVRQLAAAQAFEQWTDRQLLQRFAAGRDEAAFTLLVRRHGPMVLGLCRRVLGHEQDAEDAFQAAFLLLARKADSIRQTDVGGWLYRVAYHVAVRARVQMRRRKQREQQGETMSPTDPLTEAAWNEMRQIVDEELQRLPDEMRAALVLCHLEGKTQDEAARLLGWSKGTLRRRLGQGRELLRRRLLRRGLAPVAALTASLLGEGNTSATVSAALADATVRAVLSGPASLAIAALVEAGAALLAGSKVKVAKAFLLAVSLLGGAGLWAYRGPTAAIPIAPAQPSAAKADDKPRPTTPKREAAKTEEFRGQVLDPDGKPFAGAKLHFIYPTKKEVPIPARATSDAEGRFRFRIAKTDFDTSKLEQWEDAIVVAAAEGYGLGMAMIQAGKSVSHTALMLRLAKDDAPLKGRILDLQGKPVVGAAVRVLGLLAPVKSDLVAFVSDLKDKKELYPPMNAHLFGFAHGWNGPYPSTLFAPVKTGDDGRFEVKGVGRERLAALRIEGPTIATRDVYAMTRAGDTIQAPGYRKYEPRTDKLTLYGNGFDHIAAPCRPIVGVVRDKDTGKPIPGAVITSHSRAGPATVADKNGRYRLLGMPKGEGNIIGAGPPENEPYLIATQNIANLPGLEPITADFALKRGVWISGRVLDKITRQPLRARVQYVVFNDNPHLEKAPGLWVDLYLESRVEDGMFRVAALPGRGLLAARAWSDNYRMAVGADKIKGMGPHDHFLTSPFLLPADTYHTLVEVNPAVDAKEMTCNLLLDPGHTLKGELHGPDGKPLAGARVSGLRYYGGHGLWENEPLKTSAFTVTGLDAEQPRLLEFACVEKKLAGSVVVKGDDKGPLVVKLVPAAALTGRLVTPEGKPVTDGELTLRGAIDQPQPRNADPTVGSFRGNIRPDKDGRFRIEGLVPGLTYYLGFVKGMYGHQLSGVAGDKLTFEQGQTRNLGDVVVKRIE